MSSGSRTNTRSRPAPCCSRRAPSTGGSRSSDLAEFEGLSVFYAAGAPEAQLCGGSRVAVVGGGNSAGQAAVWLARGGALVTLLHRRADLRETMSDYLIHELERYGVAVRDRSEIAELHGEDGPSRPSRLRAATPPVLVPVPLPRSAARAPSGSTTPSRRDHDGFILTGAAAGVDDLLETDIPGVFAAGDVRSGSTKRCATAVGEGAMAVQFVHAHLSRTPAVERGDVSTPLHPPRPDRRPRAAGVGRRLRGLPADTAASGCTSGSVSPAVMSAAATTHPTGARSACSPPSGDSPTRRRAARSGTAAQQ